MSAKVSIVIACYNKAPYIGALLDTICEQVYDNIEIIMVNDGSTDRTWDVVREWEPELINHGYSVTLIEQENAGVAAAIKTGLAHATGDYVCFPDADDELFPTYVSDMADILEQDSEPGFVSCEFIQRDTEDLQISRDTKEHQELDYDIFKCDKRLEKQLLLKFGLSVWNYMYRKDFLDKIGLPMNIVTKPPFVQEPQLHIPLFFSDARGVKLNKPLYIYNTFASGVGAAYLNREGDPAAKILSDYYELQVKTIDHLPISEDEKNRYKRIARIGNLQLVLAASEHIPDSFIETCLSIVNTLYPDICFGDKITNETGLIILLRAISDKLLNVSYTPPAQSGSIIAYGALGGEAERLLPFIEDTPLWPAVFCDRSATKNSVVFDRYHVTVFNHNTINRGDTVFCFPKSGEIFDEVKQPADEKGAYIYSNDDLEGLIAAHLYPYKFN